MVDGSTNDEERQLLHAFRFDEPKIVPVTHEYSELQRAIMPVVGFADGYVEPFATSFCISVSMSIVLTAWHVIDDFLDRNAAGMRDGTCQLAVVFETAERLPSGQYLGGPLPVYSVTHLPGTDLGLLRLCDVLSGSELVQPARLAGIAFDAPPTRDYCYGFGYPNLAGGPVTMEDGKAVVDFQRVLHATGGRVWDVYPRGQDAEGKLPRWCPYFDCDAPTPSGMSGGPVMTDQAGLCGMVSTSYEPYEPDDRWSSNVSLLAPLLGCPVHCHDASGNVIDATIHELATDGHIEVRGDLPDAPPTASVETVVFPVPPTLP